MRVERRAPPKLPPPTMEERAQAAASARALRDGWPVPIGDIATFVAHIHSVRGRRRSVWVASWITLPGLKRVNDRYEHELLPGWEYTEDEVAEEMIADLERLAEKGERPTEATR